MQKSWYNRSVGHQPVSFKWGNRNALIQDNDLLITIRNASVAPIRIDRLAISSLKKQNRSGCTETCDVGDGQLLPINKLLKMSESANSTIISYIQYYALKLSSIAKLIPGTVKSGDKQGSVYECSGSK